MVPFTSCTKRVARVLGSVFAMALLQLLHIDEIRKMVNFRGCKGDDDIVFFSAISMFMKRNLWLSAIRVVFYDSSFQAKMFNISPGSVSSIYNILKQWQLSNLPLNRSLHLWLMNALTST